MISGHSYAMATGFLTATATGLVAVVESEHLDSWAKLTAIPVLGAVIIALLIINWKVLTRQLETHERVMAGITLSHEKVSDAITHRIDLVRQDHRESLERNAQAQTEMLKEVLQNLDHHQ